MKRILKKKNTVKIQVKLGVPDELKIEDKTTNKNIYFNMFLIYEIIVSLLDLGERKKQVKSLIDTWNRHVEEKEARKITYKVSKKLRKIVHKY